MIKDWTGNKKTAYVQLGASNHTDKIREKHDYYATHPDAVKELLNHKQFDKNVWECAVGEKHISNVLEEYGYIVKKSDIINRTGDSDIEIINFLNVDYNWDGDIITNPPYKFAMDFVLKALSIIPTKNKIAMFLKIQFLEGQERYKKLFSKYPPQEVLCFTKRTICAMNGDFEKYTATALFYAWFIWEKGWYGKPQIEWIYTGEEKENKNQGLLF